MANIVLVAETFYCFMAASRTSCGMELLALSSNKVLPSQGDLLYLPAALLRRNSHHTTLYLNRNSRCRGSGLPTLLLGVPSCLKVVIKCWRV